MYKHVTLRKLNSELLTLVEACAYAAIFHDECDEDFYKLDDAVIDIAERLNNFDEIIDTGVDVYDLVHADTSDLIHTYTVQNLYIKIDDANADEINDFIASKEGRARERKATFDDIQNLIASVEKKLNGIPKKVLNGTIINFENRCHFANCYKGRPESTQFRIICDSGNWYLIKCSVKRDNARGKKTYTLELSETAKQALIQNIEAGR